MNVWTKYGHRWVNQCASTRIADVSQVYLQLICLKLSLKIYPCSLKPAVTKLPICRQCLVLSCLGTGPDIGNLVTTVKEPWTGPDVRTCPVHRLTSNPIHRDGFSWKITPNFGIYCQCMPNYSPLTHRKITRINNKVCLSFELVNLLSPHIH
jgi:hypothetical protein